MNIKTIGTLVLLGITSIGFSCNGQKMNHGEDSVRDPSPLIMHIYLDREHQTMHSFGASDAWNMKYIGKNWPVKKRNEIADLLFSQEFDDKGNPNGIGLSLWRFFIGAGSKEQGESSGIERAYRREECFLKPDGTFDWSKQQGQQWFLKAAKERGVDYLLGFTCSPPVCMTRNGKAYGLSGIDLGKLNLKKEEYTKFASFISEVIKHFDASGLSIDYFSPFNEPQWDWLPSNPTTEGTGATNNEMFDVITTLNDQFKLDQLSAKIVFGESAAQSYMYEDAIDKPGRSNVIMDFWNPASEHYLGNMEKVKKVVSSHSYFSNDDITSMINNRDNIREKVSATGSGVKFWQTEYCILGNEQGMEGNGRDLGIDPALHIAQVIYSDVAIANATSWQWWLGVSPSDYKDGLVYVTDMDGRMGELATTKQDGLVFQSKMLWALGNFSRFIRPGMIRVECKFETMNDPKIALSNVMISAFKDVKNKKLVNVLINMTKNSQKVVLPEIWKDNIQSYTTSATKNMAWAPLNDKESFSLEARSITTLVGEYK